MAQVTRAIIPYQYSQNPADLSANVRSLQDFFSDATVDVVFGTITATTITGAVVGNVTGNVTGSSGSCTGNAATATILATARAINGVNFDGSAAITVTAAAGTLSGTTLAAGVVTSSLTSVGTLGALTVTGAITANGGIINTGTITSTGDIYTTAWGDWTPTLAVSGGTAPTYTAKFVNRFAKVGKMVYFQISWDNSAGGTTGSGANTLTFTLPVTAGSSLGNDAAIGSGLVYEGGGTTAQVMVNFASTTTGYFRNVITAITGNDQSSAGRAITVNGFYEASS